MEYNRSRIRHRLMIFFLVISLLASMFIAFDMVYLVKADSTEHITISCYNESNTSESIDFDIFFTNLSGTQAYDNSSMPTPSQINFSELEENDGPLNTITKIKATNISYSPRTITYYLSTDSNSTLTFYLPYFNFTNLYYVRVVDYLNDPIDDVKVNMSKYINGSFQLIDSKYTNANGMASFYLIPNDEYQVSLYKSGYHSQVETFDADPTDFGYDIPLLYKLRETTIDIPDRDELYKNITWSLEPNGYYFNHSFTVYFNITSYDGQLTSYQMDVFKENTSNATGWDLLYTNTSYDATGGSIDYLIENNTGKYKIRTFFTKDGFPEEEITPGGIYYFIGWGGIGYSEMFNEIPSWVLFTILIIASACITAFILPYGGIGSGFVGIGVMILGLSVLPEIVINGVNAWSIVTIMSLMYLVGLLLWSRI